MAEGGLFNPAGGAGSGGVNIAASNTTYTSGTVVLSGGANITVGTNGQTITISGGAGGAGGALSAIQASDATYTSGTVVFTGSNAATVKSGAGQKVVIDVPVQTAETAISGVSASDTVYTSGTVKFTGSNAVTVRSTTGQAVVIDAPVQTAATAISGLQNSQTTYTSGTVNLVDLANITIRSTTGQKYEFSVPAGANATGNVGGLAASNTTYTSGTVTITGVGGGVTVSSNTGQRVDISVAAPVAQTGTQFSAGISGGNTAGDTGTVAGRVVFAGGNRITLSGSTNGVSETITISAPNAQTAISGLAGSNTTYTSGTVTITGVGGGITVSSNTGQRIDLSVAAPVAQTVQTQNVVDVTLSGNTAGAMALVSSGTLTLAGGNNITLSQAGNAVTISGGAGGAETQTAISGIAASNTTYTSGSVTFTGVGGGVTVSSNTGQRVDISVAAPVAQTGTQFSAGLSNIGNTSGDTGTVAGRLVLAGGNNITLSGSTNGVSETVTISAGAGGGGGFNLSLSTTAGGGTSGTMAEISSGTVTLYAGNNITLSQSATNKVVLSALASSSLSAVAPISLSTTGSTIKIYAGPNLDYFDNMGANNQGAFDAAESINYRRFKLAPLTPFNEVFPGNMTASTVMLRLSHNATATSNSSSHSSTVMLAVYTRANATQLSLLNSVSTTWAQAAATNQTASYNGMRYITIHSSQWSTEPSFSQTQYWIGYNFNSNNFSTAASVMGQFFAKSATQASGSIMSSVATSDWMGLYPFVGVSSGGTRTNFPTTIGITEMAKTNASGGALMPHLVFNNITRSF